MDQSNRVRMIGLYVLIVKVLNGTREDKCQFESDFIFGARIPISRRICDLHLTVIHKYNILLVHFIDRAQQCVSHHPCFPIRNHLPLIPYRCG